MSTLDQAFLKAYRTGQAAPVPETPYAPASHAPPGHAWMGSQQPAAYTPPHAVIPAPHANFAAAPIPPVTLPVDVPTSRAAFEVPRFGWPAIVGNLITRGIGEFNTLAAELVHRSRQQRKVLLVTGPKRGVGRSTVTLALARVAAAQGLNVCVADADARHPQLADHLGVEAQLGWADVLAHGWSVDEALIESVEEHITLLPWRSTSPSARPTESGRGMAESLAALRASYDLVLIDGLPLDSDQSAVNQATLLTGSPVDDALLVHDAGHGGPEPLAIAGRRLAALGIVRWDVVENFVRG